MKHDARCTKAILKVTLSDACWCQHMYAWQKDIKDVLAHFFLESSVKQGRTAHISKIINFSNFEDFLQVSQPHFLKMLLGT